MSHMQKTVKMTLKVKLPGNEHMDRIFIILKKKLTPGGILTLSWSYIYIHVDDLYSQQSL